MNVLIINQNKNLQKEYKDFFSLYGIECFFTADKQETISLLSHRQIDKIILFIDDIYDIGILQFINTNYKKTKVILLTNKNFKDAFSIMRESDFEIIDEPMILNELKNKILKQKKGEL